jgi:hypothetical protein
MRFARAFMAFTLVFGTYMFGCPNQPGILGGVVGLRMQVSAATGLPTAILWDYDFTLPLNKACGAATTNCVSGFVITYQTTSGAPVGTPTNVPLPTTISSTGPTVGITTPYAGPTSLGSWQITLTLNYKDGTGTVQAGPTATIPLQLTPGVPVNLHVQ